MKKTTYYYLFILPLIFFFGLWLQGFWGGFACGIALVLSIVFFVGRRLANKAAQLMDKQVIDKILYSND